MKLPALAHDFNNLLGAILAHAAYIQSLAAPEDDVHESALAIQKAVGRATALASRINTETDSFEPVPVDLHAIIGELVSLLRPTSAAVRIHLDLKASNPVVSGDALLLLQMLLNLAINAREAMPGGGELTLSTEDAPSGGVLLTVCDTGRGIPPEMQGLVFEPSVTTKVDGTGGGLGLPIVRSVVDKHGGSIELSSCENQGTAFRIHLPV